MHRGSNMMYNNIKPHYWWLDIKRDIIDFVSKFFVCQQFKVEHQVPSRLLQPISIPQWK